MEDGRARASSIGNVTFGVSPGSIASRFSVNGKHVIVTGAAGGIGSAVALLLGRNGARLSLADIRLHETQQLVRQFSGDGIEAIACPLDIRHRSSVREMVMSAQVAYGPVDVFIHCAGLDAPRGAAWDLDDDDHWERIIDIDLNGAWRCASAVIPHMIERASGRIILIGSVAGRQGSSTASVAYSAAKAGIHGLTMGLARQLEGAGILVNAITPGPTGTGEAMTEQEVALEKARFALPIAGPDPVADACLFLAGDGGSWISGSLLNVSGGRWYG